MLATVLSTFKKLLGVGTDVSQTHKRHLGEGEEEYEEGISVSQPLPKKRCTGLLHPSSTPLTSSLSVQPPPRFSLRCSEPSAASKMSSLSKTRETEGPEIIIEDTPRKKGSVRRGPASACVEVAVESDEEDASTVLGRREARKVCELATRRPPLAHSTLADFRFVPSVTQPVDQEAVKQRSKIPYLSKNSKSQKPLYSKPTTDFKGYFDRLWGRRKPFAFMSSRTKHSLVQKSFQHEEKMRYRQLLQQYTEHYLSPSSRTSSQQASSSFSSPVGMVTRSQLTPLWTKQKQEQIENASGESSSTRVLPFADSEVFTEFLGSGREGSLGRHHSQEPSSSFSVPVVDLVKEDSDDNDNSVASIKESDSDSIIVVKEVLSPAVHQNSLEEKLKQHPLYDLDWVKYMRKEYEDQVQASVRNADVTRKAIQDLEESRNRRALLDEKVTQRLQFLDLSYSAKYTELPDEEEEEAFVPLTPEMESEIDEALNKTPASVVLIEKFHIQITRRDIATLDGLNWLNDEVINFYMNLIMERGQQNDNYPSVYAFNTFFYPKLSKSGYQSVRRWTKKVDIFGHDMLLVPIHLGMHWCMAHIDFKIKCISYYDSMLSSNERCLQSLLEYLKAEHQDKKGSPYNTSDWKLENKKKIPQQMNGSDCGMFSCKFAEYLSRRARINFDQEHMPYFRRRMVYEIINGRLL